VPGFVYVVRWSFPAVTTTPVNRTALEAVQTAKQRLLAIAREAAEGGQVAAHQYSKIREILQALEASLRAELLAPPGTQLDISLMVFDDDPSQQVLRFVGTAADDIASLWSESFRSGEGCAGFVFEKGRPLLYDAGAPDDIGLYIKPEERREADGQTALIPYKCLLTLPWLHAS